MLAVKLPSTEGRSVAWSRRSREVFSSLCERGWRLVVSVIYKGEYF